MQVAQLAEQQVQGCTARITHLETDVAHQVDSLKQQQTDQASSLAGVQADLEKLSTAQHASGSEQLAAQLNMLEARVSEMQKLSVTDDDSGSEQPATRLSRLEATVTQLQTAPMQDKAGLHLKNEVELLKNQLQELHNTYASQQKAASVLNDLERDVAAVKAALCDSQTSKRSADSTAAGLQQDLVALKDHLSQLSMTHAQEASKTQQPVLELERTVAELHGAVAQLEAQVQEQHAGAEILTTLQQELSDLKAQLGQLQSLHSSGGPSAEVYSGLQQDVAAAQDQLSSLEKQVAQEAGRDSWKEESQKLRSELDACLRAASSAEAVVARHTTELSRLESRFAELHAEPKEGPHASGSQGGAQSEVEELNERLFELRVEVQNLADDTGISIASMKRKVRYLVRAYCLQSRRARCHAKVLTADKASAMVLCTSVFMLRKIALAIPAVLEMALVHGFLKVALSSTRAHCP